MGTEAQPHIERVSAFVCRAGSFQRPNVFNPWADWDEQMDRYPDAPGIRRNLLSRFLMIQRPQLVLIGEAGGYRGLRYVGIPLSSEALLNKGAITRLEDWKGRRLTVRPRPWAEATATIIWRVLNDLDCADNTVLWNAFPCHPHRPGKPWSNRPPSAEEVDQGRPILSDFLDLFPRATVCAVGQVASASLSVLETEHLVLRHPSRGGAVEFARGLRQVCRDKLK